MLAKETTLNIQEVKTLGAGLIRHGARPDDLAYGRTDPDAQRGTGDRLEEAAREFLSQPRVMPGSLPQRASADVHSERENMPPPMRSWDEICAEVGPVRGSAPDKEHERGMDM